jgi:hypothetical protein
VVRAALPFGTAELIRKAHRNNVVELNPPNLRARSRTCRGLGPRQDFVLQAQGGPRLRYYSGLEAFRLRDGSPNNQFKRPCIHGTYLTHCSWCRQSPTPPGGPSEGHGVDGGAGAMRGDWRRRHHGPEWLCIQERWNPEVVNIFGAAARYRRATDGSSHDDAHPDKSTLH